MKTPRVQIKMVPESVNKKAHELEELDSMHQCALIDPISDLLYRPCSDIHEWVSGALDPVESYLVSVSETRVPRVPQAFTPSW